MKLLLHCCCAPCSVSCVEPLRLEGIEPVAFWYNPNIHPFKEYEARRDCLVEHAKATNLSLLVDENYGLRDFVKTVAHDIDGRCEKCYAIRLDRTAKYAKDHGFDAFCTTLLSSIYQDHEKIVAIAKAAAEKHGVEFLYRDFRPNFRVGNNTARDMGLYMQKYCGCIFSEEDRYRKNILKAKEKFNT